MQQDGHPDPSRHGRPPSLPLSPPPRHGSSGLSRETRPLFSLSGSVGLGQPAGMALYNFKKITVVPSAKVGRPSPSPPHPRPSAPAPAAPQGSAARTARRGRGLRLLPPSPRGLVGSPWGSAGRPGGLYHAGRGGGRLRWGPAALHWRGWP